MDHSALVRGFQTLGNLAADFEGLLNTQGTFAQPLGEGLTLDQLQDQKAHSIGLFQAMDRGNVGVIEGGQDLSLASKPGQPLGGLGESLRENLDGDFAL